MPAKAKKSTKKAAKPKAKKAAKPKAKAAAPKAAAKKAAPAKAEIKKQLVGTVEHFYGGISVAVVKATAPIKVGDEILIERGDGSFTQKIDSMQIEHQNVPEVKPGDSFGLKVAQKATEGNKVYKIIK